MKDEIVKEIKNGIMQLLSVFGMFLLMLVCALLFNAICPMEGGYKEALQWLMYGQILVSCSEISKLKSKIGIS